MECGILEKPKQEKKNQDRLSWVDSLKGIAICAIVWVHAGGGSLGNILDPLGKAGAYWVEMFFILAVYLACRSLKSGTVSNSFVWFLHRLWKLTPLYYFMLLLYIVVVPEGANIWLGTSVNRVNIVNTIMHVLYLHSFFPYFVNSVMWVEWYLGVMVIYMAVLPILCKYIRRRKEAVGLVVVFAVSSFLITSLLSLLNPLKDEYIWNGWVYTYSFILHMPSLGAGILLYYLDDLQLKRESSRMLCGISITGYITLSYLSAYGETIRLIRIFKISGFTLVFLFFVLGVQRSNNIVFHNRIWQTIGQNSYGIYLLHFLLIFVCAHFISDEFAVSNLRSSCLWQIIKFLIIMCLCLCFSIIYNKIAGERIYAWGKRKLSQFFA
jgi:peptidoglycan/LPS O-acetylase OafA/YrhL